MHNIESPDPTDPGIERQIQTKGLTAPRVTPTDLAANMAHVDYVRYISYGGQVLRWAVITTRNGFAVTGNPSVAVSPANDDAAIGEQVALENAKNSLWPLMGYQPKEQLFEQANSGKVPA